MARVYFLITGLMLVLSTAGCYPRIPKRIPNSEIAAMIKTYLESAIGGRSYIFVHCSDEDDDNREILYPLSDLVLGPRNCFVEMSANGYGIAVEPDPDNRNGFVVRFVKKYWKLNGRGRPRRPIRREGWRQRDFFAPPSNLELVFKLQTDTR